MTGYEATEIAYKNGYAKGFEDGIKQTSETTEIVRYARRGLHLGHRHYCSMCGKLAYMEKYCSQCGATVVEKEND